MQACMHDLTPELLRRTIKTKNFMMLRAVCKGMKSRIAELPEIEIKLSPAGTASVTSRFFSHFKGNISVTSKCISESSIGWFEALIDAVQHGVKVETISKLRVNRRKACAVSEALDRFIAHGVSSSPIIKHISVSFEGRSSGLRNSLSAMSKLSSVAREVEISMDLSFRSPVETLWGLNQQIMSLGSCFTAKDVCIRFALFEHIARPPEHRKAVDTPIPPHARRKADSGSCARDEL